MLNLATVTEALNDTPTARNYFDQVNEISRESSENAVNNSVHWGFLQTTKQMKLDHFVPNSFKLLLF